MNSNNLVVHNTARRVKCSVMEQQIQIIKQVKAFYARLGTIDSLVTSWSI